MAKKKKKSSNGAILIKRYGNRRLYNTETKEYVTYDDVADIVRDGHDIKVIDSKTKEDVTKAVLIHVILEEEKEITTTIISSSSKKKAAATVLLLLRATTTTRSYLLDPSPQIPATTTAAEVKL